MANVFSREPETGGDSGVWGPLQLSQNRPSLGILTCQLYDDSGALKMKVGKIGLDNGSKKGFASYDTETTISIASVSNSNWAKIELSVSGTTPMIAGANISGETTSTVIPSEFKNSYDPEKGGYYIAADKRCIGIVYKDSGGNLANIINVASLQEGFFGNDGNTSKIGSMWSPAVPIGAIIAWHKSFTGVPELPENWVECDGSVISDSESLLDGQTLPDLNGDARFLRGGATSGTEQNHAFMEHGHTNSYGGTADLYDLGAILKSGTGANYAGQTRTATPSANNLTARDAISIGGDSPEVATETRPINMNVVWIMRIK